MLTLTTLERFALVLVRNDRVAEKDPPVVAMFFYVEGRHALATWWYPLDERFAPSPYHHSPHHILRRVEERDITPALRRAHKAFVDSEIRIREQCRIAHGRHCTCPGCHPRGMR